MERVRRFAGHRLSPGGVLTAPPLTPEQARKWGEYVDNSPIYRRLIEVVADDPDLMVTLNLVEGSPRPNVLFGGVQYLMLRDGPGELGQFYPNLATQPRGLDEIAGPFRDFVISHREELAEIGRTRFTQTNECRRCVALLPGIWETPAARFHLVDLGTSAGLNLNLDRYHYRWGSMEWGPDSPVSLVTDMRGRPVAPRPVEIVSRTGLDLNPLDPTDPDDRLWLQALIWPEHHDRRQRLLGALELAARHPPRLVSGDAVVTLGPLLEALPKGEPVVVINSFILNQLPAEMRTRIEELIDEQRVTRPIYRVSMEWLDTRDESSSLEVDLGSGMEKIGAAHPHGEWLELYARP